jgi:hypothetical protein
MPGSLTTPGRTCACVGAQLRVAFRRGYGVGTRDDASIAAQWLACAFPCRRFGRALTDTSARLGASVARYAFTAEDFHLILLAGLPAHSLEARTVAPLAASGSSFEARPRSAVEHLRMTV